MRIDWHQFYAAVWRSYKQGLKPITRLDSVSMADLLAVDQQMQALLENTRHFIEGKPSNHALLWGARGTGKSSLIKALLNEFAPAGLRVIQLDKADLSYLPEILDSLEQEDAKFHFIIFCDDLSFEEGELSYKPLKTLLEGGLELPPERVRLYATSNRRHLLPEKQSENQQGLLVDGEVHHADSLEDKLALSDRFGLTLAFYPVKWDNYFEIVESLFTEFTLDREELLEAAKMFAMLRGSHSGRTAKQFYQHYCSSLL